MDKSKPRQVRLCMNEEMQSRWKQVMEVFPDLTETQVHGLVMGAALRALEGADYRFSVPLTFTVGRDVPIASLRR